MEEQYGNNPTPENLRVWAEEQQIYSTLMIRKAKNKQLFQRQKTFGEVISAGRMLAHLVKTNSPSSMVPTISIGEGRVSSYTPEIVDEFKEHYEHLYSFQQQEMEEEVDAFFRGLAKTVSL